MLATIIIKHLVPIVCTAQSTSNPFSNKWFNKFNI